ncbi:MULTISPECIES: pyroglutamyl-peptidase I [Vibrio]|uniref:pyroglutamyl-peptidase I n=1 Tax=Vibrio TaxID=662 RepID=UPI001373342F|nr:pyroglutamyl-peptidase I [Vibrio sp. V33_P6A3T137]EKO3571485.1 pyroglutamyl-peptidase I [Vibrio metschnikovii]EKO3577457.1 pyroglutamyl-peptidase I [Vibrio metschnikovii]EKO3655645.1 pyroglutamyl-peptidase I [Vibrio metschnikovii]EKO3675775.1 pyroglutamyl-peptidase I [Vibrio metschnikovii]NAW78774.1 pyroglutamyl-peptidase I [Vibrio sp. V33_P6A3T137]
MFKVLLTGFEPFGEDSLNPSQALLNAKEQLHVTGVEVIGCVLPVVRYQAAEVAINAIKTHQPDLVLMFGQASGRAAITPERVAINLDDYRIADNAGHQPIDEAIIADGPAAYFTTLPVKAMVEDLQQAGIAAEVSYSAGTFVCNHLFYAVQHYLSQHDIPSGFIHIPALPEQVPATNPSLPSLGLEPLIAAVRVMIQTCHHSKQDRQIIGGSVC